MNMNMIIRNNTNYNNNKYSSGLQQSFVILSCNTNCARLYNHNNIGRSHHEYIYLIFLAIFTCLCSQIFANYLALFSL